MRVSRPSYEPEFGRVDGERSNMNNGFEELPRAGRRDQGEASEAVGRKIWLLMELIQYGSVRFSKYDRTYGRDKRSFQRDLQQLRSEIDPAVFAISRLTGDIVHLVGYEQGLLRSTRAADSGGATLALVVAELSRAFGEPLQRELGNLAGPTGTGDSFLHVHAPQLADGSHVSRVYEKLRDAWSSPAGRASVRFKYAPSRGEVEERTVDPYRVIARSGRYYLLGYDVGRRGWRFYALDAIVGVPVKAGTAAKTRPIPADYTSSDALGFFKVRGQMIPVVVELSQVIATAVTSRVWNEGQIVEKLANGRARITIPVADPREVVRWAFGYGADAKVVAPPDAVEIAAGEATAIAGHYVGASRTRRV